MAPFCSRYVSVCHIISLLHVSPMVSFKADTFVECSKMHCGVAYPYLCEDYNEVFPAARGPIVAHLK